MRGSVLEFYVNAAYGGIIGIFNRKSWMKAMRAFQSVGAALLQRFLSTGQTLQTARIHPTGRHLVDNFLLPTRLIHHFQRIEQEGDVHLNQLIMKRMMKY